VEFLAAIEGSALADAIGRSVWAYPALEIVHIASFGTLIGSLLLLELRVFGVARTIDVLPLAKLAVRTALVAFACAAGSGLLLFASNATEFGVHPAFRVKLVLIAIAGVNALVFHLRDSVRRHDGIARVQAAASLVLWLLVLSAGRLIAYI
jgi:hypothetical protein